MDHIESSQIIDALGGTVATAKLCDLTKGAISQWRTNGIPKPWMKYLHQVRPDLFVGVAIEKSGADPREAA